MNKCMHTATRNTYLIEKHKKNKNRDDDTKCFTYLRTNVFILIDVLMDRFAY